MVINSRINNDAGCCAGMRMYGRSPRLPINAIDTAYFPDLLNPISPEMQEIHYLALLNQIREKWTKYENIRTIRKSLQHAPRKTIYNELFLGQSVYYWHNDPRTKRPTWKGPALIAGTWGTGEVLIAHGNSFVTISNENIHTTNKVLDLIGSDSSLQLHTMGTSIPLFQVDDAKQLVFLMRYRDNLIRQIKPTIATLDLQNLDPLKELEDPDFKSKVNFDLGGEFEFDVFLETMRGSERERLSEAQIKVIGDISAKLEEQVKFHL